MVHIIPESGFANTYLIEEDAGLIAVDVAASERLRKSQHTAPGRRLRGRRLRAELPYLSLRPANP